MAEVIDAVILLVGNACAICTFAISTSIWKFWPVFNNFGKFLNELIDEGKVFVQKEDIAEQMNNHFCSLGSKLASCIPDTASQPEDFWGQNGFKFLFSPSKRRIHSQSYFQT